MRGGGGQEEAHQFGKHPFPVGYAGPVYQFQSRYINALPIFSLYRSTINNHQMNQWLLSEFLKNYLLLCVFGDVLLLYNQKIYTTLLKKINWINSKPFQLIKYNSDLRQLRSLSSARWASSSGLWHHPLTQHVSSSKLTHRFLLWDTPLTFRVIKEQVKVNNNKNKLFN